MENMDAILAAIEQAKQALDQIEAQCAKEEGGEEQPPAEGAAPPMPMPDKKMPMP